MPTQKQGKSTSKQLGNHLDSTQDFSNIDIITLVGTMTKEDEAFYTNIFLSDDDNTKYNP